MNDTLGYDPSDLATILISQCPEEPALFRSRLSMAMGVISGLLEDAASELGHPEHDPVAERLYELISDVRVAVALLADADQLDASSLTCDEAVLGFFDSPNLPEDGVRILTSVLVEAEMARRYFRAHLDSEALLLNPRAAEVVPLVIKSVLDVCRTAFKAYFEFQTSEDGDWTDHSAQDLQDGADGAFDALKSVGWFSGLGLDSQGAICKALARLYPPYLLKPVYWATFYTEARAMVLCELV